MSGMRFSERRSYYRSCLQHIVHAWSSELFLAVEGVAGLSVLFSLELNATVQSVVVAALLGSDTVPEVAASVSARYPAPG